MRRSVFIVGMVLALGAAGCSESNSGNNNNNANGNQNQNQNQNNNTNMNQNFGALVINEIAAKGDPADWVEIYNPTSEAIDLEGVYITDDIAGQPTRARIPAGFVVPAMGYLKLDVSDATFGFGLGGDEECAIFTPDEVLIDSVDWPDNAAPEGKSYGRIPDGTGDFKTLDTPTPGAANVDNTAPQTCGNSALDTGEVCDGALLDGGTCVGEGFAGGTLTCNATCTGYVLTACTAWEDAILINEVGSKGDDIVELYNSGDASFVLTGWSLVDSTYPTDIDHIYTFTAADEIGPGGYFVMIKDSHHTFGLGGDDAVILRNANDDIVDQADWPDGGAVISYCRIPNVTGSFKSCAQATPGAENLDWWLMINEVASVGDDQIELYNPGTQAAPVAGWFVVDADFPGDPTHQYALPVGTSVAAGGYLVLVKDTDHDFGIGADDAIRLCLPADTDCADPVDEITWTGHADPSFGRETDGAEDWYLCTAASWNSSNNCPAPAP